MNTQIKRNLTFSTEYVYRGKLRLTISGNENKILSKTDWNTAFEYEIARNVVEFSAVADVVIGDGILNIPSDAFSYLPNAEYLTVGDSVTDIDEHALFERFNIKEITLSKNIKNIKKDAIIYCGDAKIYFDGTTEECKSINIEKHVEDYHIICSDGELLLPGYTSPKRTNKIVTDKTDIKDDADIVLTKSAKQVKNTYSKDIKPNITPAIKKSINELTKREIRKIPMTKDEVRFMVDRYYDMQKMRIATGNQDFALHNNNVEISEDNALSYISDAFKDTEKSISKFLDVYTDNHPIGQWLKSIMGIGPVLAAGLLAYIDMDKVKTAGALWKYAGWDVGYVRPKRGQKINYNPKFRTLCWKIGDCFIKMQNREGDIYGHLYKEKKDWYIAKNESGGFAEKAQYELSLKTFSKDTNAYKAYSAGKLPDAQINAMASRFAVKIFLSHLFEVWYMYHNNAMPPKPFVEEHLGHVHIISAPNKDIVEKYIK